MKLSLLCVFVFLLLISSSKVRGGSIDFQPDQLCNPDFIWHPSNLISAREIDVNLDSISELLLLIQYNNNAQFHLFHHTDCGFEEVTDDRGEPIAFLSYASSSICQPIGCHENTFCASSGGLRHLVNVRGRHTLTLEQRHMWQSGNLSDEDVTSQITITKYRLIQGTLIEVHSRVVPDLLKNIKLFNPNSSFQKGSENSEGFEFSTCD